MIVKMISKDIRRVYVCFSLQRPLNSELAVVYRHAARGVRFPLPKQSVIIAHVRGCQQLVYTKTNN